MGYQRQDLANNLFLVTSGTFAHIGVPQAFGGKDVRFLAASRSSQIAATHMYPYQLFSTHNYFGDEMLQNSHHRFASVRCENRGEVLIVGAKDVHKLTARFPEYGVQWVKESRRREWHRMRLLRGFHQGHSYRHLAC